LLVKEVPFGPNPRRKRRWSAYLANHLDEAWPGRGSFSSLGLDALEARLLAEGQYHRSHLRRKNRTADAFS